MRILKNLSTVSGNFKEVIFKQRPCGEYPRYGGTACTKALGWGQQADECGYRVVIKVTIWAA